MSKKILLCDLDDVLWELMPIWCQSYGECINNNLITPSNFYEWDISSVLGNDSGVFYSLLDKPQFWDRVVEENKETIDLHNHYINLLKGYYDVYVVTSTRYTHSYKLSKFFESFSSIDENHVVLAHNKWLLEGDIVIDDKGETLEKFMRKGVRCVKINKPWNSWFDCESYNSFYETALVLLREVDCFDKLSS